MKCRETERQTEVVLKILLRLRLGTSWYGFVNCNVKWVERTRNFKILRKRFDADHFILISVCTWLSVSRWYTSDFDVVTNNF